jgi:molecular chaperone GrpE
MTQGTDHDAEEQRVVVRDKRRIDPESGELREPVEGAAPSTAEPAAPVDDARTALQAQLEERTADLQRVKAEYDNYRRRVDRDRTAVVEQAAGSVLAHLVPLLDDVERAREHGELQGAFKAVAETLEATLTKLGLERFGQKGEPFDPTRHEAVMHSYSDDVTTATCVDVMRPGYLFADRLLRPAMVAVADPTPGEQPTE